MEKNRRITIWSFLLPAAILILALPMQRVGSSQETQDRLPVPPSIPPNPSTGQSAPSPEVPPIKELGENRVQIGNILIDTKKREVTVPGRILQDQILEFLATTKNGEKSYESVMELETNATTFNLAMIMIGLDRANAIAPEFHFDPTEVVGDRVEIWVEWNDGDRTREVKGEELLYNLDAQRPPKSGDWIYTGSFIRTNGQYVAEAEGVLIGFVHDPASIIENSTGIGLNEYGNIRLNPELNIHPDTPITLTVKALPE